MQQVNARLPRLSVVAPCYNEDEVIDEFCRRATQACGQAVGGDFEIILVDDGSNDNTWELIEAFCLADARFVGVRLLRNHGHQLAATAGLAVSRGARVMLIDADLQDPPELIVDMMAVMDGGADVVYGKRTSREGESWFKTTSASMFYRLLTAITKVPIPRDTGDFRLMSRSIVDALTLMPERHRFLRGIVSWIGGRQTALAYERQPRFAGQSKYPLSKMVRFAVDALTSFSTLPLRLGIWLGVAVSFFAFSIIVYAFIAWARGVAAPGWTSLVVATSFFAGIQLIVLGIVGQYLGRVVEQLQGRPLFLIGDVNRGGERHALPSEFSAPGPKGRSEVLGRLFTGPASAHPSAVLPG